MRIVTLFMGVGALTAVVLLSRADDGHMKPASGNVTSVYNTESEETIFKIAGFDCNFSLHRSFPIASLDSLKHRIVGKKVTIHYRERWTPLDPSSTKEIASIRVGDELLYSQGE